MKLDYNSWRIRIERYWIPYIYAMVEGRFVSNYNDSIERLQFGSNNKEIFGEVLWRKFKALFISMESAYRMTSWSAHRVLFSSEPSNNSVLSLILLFRTFSDERIFDDLLLQKKVNSTVLDVLDYYNYPEQLTIWVIERFIENQGDQTSANALCRSLAAKYGGGGGDRKSALLGRKSRSFGHQVMMSEYTYKHTLLCEIFDQKLALVPSLHPASEAMESINQRIFGTADIDFDRVSVLKKFSPRENGGYLGDQYYAGGYWSAILNHKLDRKGCIYSSPIQTVFNDLYDQNAFSTLIRKLKGDTKKLVLLYFRTPSWKGAVTHRDTDPNVALGLTKYLLTSGYAVCRIGDKVDIFQSISSDAFYDRPSDTAAPLGIDVALALNCDIALMGAGGASALPLALNKPTLLFDTPMTSNCFYYKNARISFRSHLRKGKVAPHEYFFQRGFNGSLNDYHLHRNDISSRSISLKQLIDHFEVFVDEVSDLESFERRSIESAYWAQKYGLDTPFSVSIN